MPENTLPAWATELKNTFLRGESSVFVLHGNVFDLILHNGELTPLIDFLLNVVLAKKDVVVHYNQANGVKFKKKEQKVENIDELYGVREAEKALPALEKLLLTQDNVAVVIDYAETVVPAGDSSFASEADRRAVVTLHRWSLDRRFENADNLVALVTETLSELSPKIVSNPKITAIQIPLPDEAQRAALIQLLEPDATHRDIEKLASLSAGLKAIQIRGILAPGEDSQEDQLDRFQIIRRSLGNAAGADDRAKHLTRVTAGYTHKQLEEFLGKEGITIDRSGTGEGRFDEVIKLLVRRKREILEKECYGLIEFVEPSHDFSAVGGMDEVKKDLMQIAKNIREGNRSRVPMGILFVGPMGTGKTFVCEAFAKSSGLTAIKMKNFRSKWVGATEGNLEKILSVVKAIGNILVIIDEGDRAFGNSEGGDGDGGTSSRVIARIKEFMSDTTNRGRVLFVLMTNRPDKLDIDIKRAGRLDKKIPFFYPQEPEEVEPVLLAQLKRHKVSHTLSFPADREAVSRRLIGYSNADIEAVVLAANDEAERTGVQVSREIAVKAIDDYLPSRDAAMLEFMELQAVFESSSRAMLPKRYAHIDVDALQERLRTLKSQFR